MSRYLDPSTVEYCQRCRCKTWHLLLPSGERRCEWHAEAQQQQQLAPAQSEPREARP